MSLIAVQTCFLPDMKTEEARRTKSFSRQDENDINTNKEMSPHPTSPPFPVFTKFMKGVRTS